MYTGHTINSPRVVGQRKMTSTVPYLLSTVTQRTEL